MSTVWDGVVPADELQSLRAAGFGAPVQLGSRPAVVVIDVVLSFLGKSPDSKQGEGYATACGPIGWERMPNIIRLVDAARENGAPVVFTKGDPVLAPEIGGSIKLNTGGEISRQIHGAPFPKELEPQSGDIIISKARASSFFGTSLLTALRKLDVDTLIIAGTTTSGCIRATAVDGFSYGFPVLVAEDSCFDRSQFAHAANLFDIEMKYGMVRSTDDAVAYLRKENLPSS